MPLTSALVVFALLLVTVQSLAQNYDQGPKSLTGGKATLHWSLHNDTRRISLALTVTDPAALNETGPAWIAIGVSEKTSGSMLGADIASAEFGAGVIDNCTLADRYVPWAAYPIEASTKNASSVYPNADASQNDGSWRLVSCSRNTTTGVATLELERPLDAHDDEDRELGPGDQAIIFAYGGSSFRYHEKQRGSTRVVLYNEDGSYPSAKIAPLPKDVSFADEIVATNFSVPTEKTTYACTARKVPLPASGKRVLVAADPIIKSTSGANKLHHLLLYACPETEYAKSFVETGFCLGNGPGENPTSKCRALVFTWAVGSERLVLPGGVGFEIDSGNNFFIMDSHYDNPDLAKNVVDISGAKLYFADDRPIQAGVLVLGDARQSLSLTGQTIKNQFEYTSSCPSKCTATWKDDINVFLSHLHMHTTGRKIATQHYSKNGTLIQNINSIEYWSNEHQYFTRFPKPKVVRPGDKLNTTCVYDTRKRPSTKFGLKTEDEMCMDFVFYYPLQKRNASDSGVFDCYNIPLSPEFASSGCGNEMNLLDGGGADGAAAESPAPDGTAADSGGCFSGSSLVQSRRGELRMRDLRVGDEIAVGSGQLSRVFMFTHRIKNGMFRFVDLRTVSTRLSLSAGHFIYVDGQLKAAEDVRVGDRLRLVDGREEVVISLRWVEREGLYNPQTTHGDIAVDGIVASTYTKSVPPSAAHALLAPFRAMQCGLPVLECDVGVGARALRSIAGWIFQLS